MPGGGGDVHFNTLKTSDWSHKASSDISCLQVLEKVGSCQRTALQSCAAWVLQVGQWTSQCLEGCMQRLSSLNKPYKYVVTCIIMQKTGEGNQQQFTCAAYSRRQLAGQTDKVCSHTHVLQSWWCLKLYMWQTARSCRHANGGACCPMQGLAYTPPHHASGTATRMAAELCAGKTRPCGVSPLFLAWRCNCWQMIHIRGVCLPSTTRPADH